VLVLEVVDPSPDPLYPCAYHPPPFNWKPVRATIFSMASAPQLGHSSGGGSLILAQTSATSAHWLQR